MSSFEHRKPESPLTKRILAVNLLAFFVLLIGFLYLGFYQKKLIVEEQKLLVTEAKLYASALLNTNYLTNHESNEMTNFIRSLAEDSNKRAYVFNAEGSMIANSFSNMSNFIAQAQKQVNTTENNPVIKALDKFTTIMLNLLPGGNIQSFPLYTLPHSTLAKDYQDVENALSKTVAYSTAWKDNRDGIILSAATPILRGEEVVGVVLLEKGGETVREAVGALRFDILIASIGALIITILLSLYLSSTIARPIEMLARAADEVRRSKKRKVDIPDFSIRQDEIAMLSESLRDMTEALWNRMDAIESFAADVSHELKNPLTSLKSAVETVARVKDQDKRDQLMVIIHHDIERLDRLISDISDASRLDAELSRAEMDGINMADLLANVVSTFNRQITNKNTCILFIDSRDSQHYVWGIESRMFQIFQNLIDNALSFSPRGKNVEVHLSKDKEHVTVKVRDYGPGLQVEKQERIFERFYTQRPEEEKFGNHSGLGLSIVKQIIDAHNGAVEGKNIVNRQGHVEGCLFTVKLPLYNVKS